MRDRLLVALAAILALLLPILPPAGSASAEPYVGVYLSGVPPSEHDIKADRTFLLTGRNAEFGVGNVDFDSSAVYGGVVGYRFLRFLAVELDAYHLSPDLQGQTRTANSVTAGAATVSTEGGDVDLTVLAFSAVGSYSFLPNERVRDGRLQLYAGAGLGILFSSVDVTGSTPFGALRVRDSDTSLGPHVKGGARWFFNKNVAGFLEFRYTRGSIDVAEEGTTFAGAPIRLRVQTDLDLPLVLLGLSVHFR